MMSTHAEIVTVGVTMLRMQLISMLFIAIALVTICIFQSAGKEFSSSLISVSRQGTILAVVIVLVLVLVFRTAGYNGVIISQAISDFLTTGLAIVLYYTGIRREIECGFTK